MVKLKYILNDLVDHTYPDSDRLRAYKRFYVKVENRNLKSKHGDYNRRESLIRVFNMYRDDSAIVATTIHELAHHIDCVNRGTTGHDEAFYAVFRDLLLTALDMKIFSRDEYLKATADAADSGKVRKMIDRYVPKDTKYKEDMARLVIRNGYEKKDALKERGYSWNPLEKLWEKEIKKEDVENEEAFLDGLGLSHEMKSTALTFAPPSKGNAVAAFRIIAGKGSFDCREELKKEGFVFNPGKKRWELGVDKNFPTEKKTEDLQKRFPELEIRIERAEPSKKTIKAKRG